MGVDILQLPKTARGNRYVIVFIDYLTKWVEVFSLKDQTALTVARTLVVEIVPRHGIPRELLLDHVHTTNTKLGDDRISIEIISI